MSVRLDVYHHFCPEDPGLAKVLAGFDRLEKLLMTQDEAIAALKAANDELKALVVSTSQEQADALANIKADEAGILAKLGTLTELSPANQAIVESVIADQQALGVKLQAQADAVRAVADNIPDAPAGL